MPRFAVYRADTLIGASDKLVNAMSTGQAAAPSGGPITIKDTAPKADKTKKVATAWKWDGVAFEETAHLDPTNPKK